MFIELKTVYSLIEAQIITTQLKDKDIDSLIEKDDVGGMYPNLQTIEGVKVFVKKEDLEKAKKIIEIKEDSNKTKWICKKCHEKHEGQFLVCWNCGEAR